jgi:hypothetical protein
LVVTGYPSSPFRREALRTGSQHGAVTAAGDKLVSSRGARPIANRRRLVIVAEMELVSRPAVEILLADDADELPRAP